VSIELTNQGSQTIVAWGLRLEERTPDGKTAVSFVANDANRAFLLRRLGLFAPNGDGVLDPAAVVVQPALVSPGTVSVSVSVVAVAFDDGRVRGDASSLSGVWKQRARLAQAAAKWLPDLERTSAVGGDINTKMSQLRASRTRLTDTASAADDEIPVLIDQLLRGGSQTPAAFDGELDLLVRYLRALREAGSTRQAR
jgi:hypothetical protein